MFVVKPNGVVRHRCCCSEKFDRRTCNLAIGECVRFPARRVNNGGLRKMAFHEYSQCDISSRAVSNVHRGIPRKMLKQDMWEGIEFNI